MTVLQKKATGGIEKRSVGFGSYIVVGLLALAIGVGAATGFNRIVDGGGLSPSQISQVRAGEYADFAENQWIAQVNATRNADLVEFYTGLHAAQLAEIQSQRATDLVGQQASLHQATVAGINEQRAQDMADHYSGMFGLTPAEIESQRAQDMATFKRGWEGETSR